MVKFAKWAKIDGPAHMSTHTPIRMFMRTFEYKVTHMSTNQFETYVFTYCRTPVFAHICAHANAHSTCLHPFLHTLPHACLQTCSTHVLIHSTASI